MRAFCDHPFSAVLDALGAPLVPCRSAFGDLFLLRFLIVCVLDIRFAGLPLVTIFSGLVLYALRAGDTQYRSTAVRATTSLRGERAHLAMLILSPPNGFLSRSLFHNPPLSCGERTG